MSLILKFLGTGSSEGIPFLGCNCNVCTLAEKKDNKNFRFFSSILLSSKKGKLLVDVSPEVRLQMMNCKKIDSVLITHPHYDHFFGLDQLKGFASVDKNSEDLPVYLPDYGIERIYEVFPYLFVDKNYPWRAALEPIKYFSEEKLNILGIEIIPFKVEHGKSFSSALFISYNGKRVVYAPDCSKFTDNNIKYLKDLDYLIVGVHDAKEEYNTRFLVDQAIEVFKEYKPKKMYFTHIGHEIEHSKISKKVPNGIEISFDGLELRISD